MKAEFVPFDVIQIFEDVHLHKKPKLAKTLEICNYIFAAIFTMEFILKAIGFGLIKYFYLTIRPSTYENSEVSYSISLRC